MVKPVANLEEAVRLLAEIENEIRALGVTRLALFGSVLRGEATAESDVDALVEFENGRKDFDSFMALAELLEATLGRPVDLVTIQSLSPHIGPHILKTASDVLRAA